MMAATKRPAPSDHHMEKASRQDCNGPEAIRPSGPIRRAVKRASCGDATREEDDIFN